MEWDLITEKCTKLKLYLYVIIIIIKICDEPEPTTLTTSARHTNQRSKGRLIIRVSQKMRGKYFILSYRHICSINRFNFCESTGGRRSPAEAGLLITGSLVRTHSGASFVNNVHKRRIKHHHFIISSNLLLEKYINVYHVLSLHREKYPHRSLLRERLANKGKCHPTEFHQSCLNKIRSRFLLDTYSRW